ncbi:hypothetical protein ACFO5K_07300 [Nocardia halotolerans]|uniref:Uncharacterized protein n=1 Tax=Nocardia halotolerans TaxID=1755878 RepID=A0ABV8VGJ2_9NOCA
MDLDEVGSRVEELATRFGVDAAPVEAGDVPTWWLDGVRPKARNQQPVLVIGPVFESLPPGEQEGALAEGLLVLHYSEREKYKLLLSLLVLAAAPALLITAAKKLGVLPDLPGWQWAAVSVLIFAVGTCAATCLWNRSIIPLLDRRMTEVLGWETTASMIDLSERARAAAPDLVGVYVRLTVPSKKRRLRRL